MCVCVGGGGGAKYRTSFNTNIYYKDMRKTSCSALWTEGEVDLVGDRRTAKTLERKRPISEEKKIYM